MKKISKSILMSLGLLFVGIATLETQTGSWIWICNKPVPESMK